jgi:PAS domain S-box-containing protein
MAENTRESLSAAAAAEKVHAAEKSVALIRAAVIVLNTFVYLFLMSKTGTIPWLAYAIIGVAWTYAFLVIILQPYRKYPIFLTSYFTSGTDALLITFWILATGGFASPFYVLWYLSIVAVSFRYSSRVILATSVLYIICYLALLASRGEISGHAADLVVRTCYIVLVAATGTLISKETLEQTFRKKQMEELALEARRSNERLEIQTTLYENLLKAQSELGEGVCITEGQKFVYVNDALCRIYGYSEGELLGSVSFLDLIHPAERETFSIKLRERLNGSDLPHNGQVIVKTKSGSSIHIAYSLKILETKGKKQLFSIIRNITDEVISRQILEQRTLDLARSKELEQKKDEFLGVASHELKTPLTSLKGYVQLLQRTLENKEDHAVAQLYATKTHVHIERLNRLISDLLDSSRIQAGKLQFSVTSFDISTLVTEAVESMQHTSQSHQIKFSPPFSQEVFADKMRLEQVLTNLISNAIKYSPKGNEVFVELSRSSNEIIVSVRDAGMGIPKEYLDKVFDRFFRVESGGKIPGLGIGLYISAEIVRRHGGRIWAESEEGQGSVFSFSLPVMNVS